MSEKKMTASTVPIYSTRGLCATCLASLVLGVLIGATLMYAGWRHLKRTSNPLSFGWSVVRQDPSYDYCGCDAPVELNFKEDTVQVTTLAGEKFESPYELVPSEGSDTELGKSIVIHDYLGRVGCDVEVTWSIQPLAHIRYRVVSGNNQLDIFSDEATNETSIEYLFCG